MEKRSLIDLTSHDRNTGRKHVSVASRVGALSLYSLNAYHMIHVLVIASCCHLSKPT